MAGFVAHIGEMKNAYRILVVRVEEKRLVVRSRQLGGCSWIYLAQDWDKW